MKKVKRSLIALVCLSLILISWAIATNSKSAADRQLALIEEALLLLEDRIFVRASSLLEEAVAFNAEHTPYAESLLKETYLALIDKQGYRRKYTELLDAQMSRKDAEAAIFLEAAEYYLGVPNLREALSCLKEGMQKTGSGILEEKYEKSRYVYETGRDIYDYASEITDSTVKVCVDGKWGISKSDGSPMIPCRYERISTFSSGRAIVGDSGEIFAVDKDDNRVAKLHAEAEDFGNYANDRVPLKIEGSWLRATGDFALGSAVFEDMSMYSGGYVAACINGKWGVIDIDSGWLLPAEYDGVICDELGRCHYMGSVFAVAGDEVLLFVNGARVGGVFEDARPFSDGGLAAVKKDGYWGFIDMQGNVVIPYYYDDALSFGQHLAAVRIDDFWGYVSVSGEVVIEPIYYEAKSFSGGSAPVLTERGWQFITLAEYKSGPGLF